MGQGLPTGGLRHAPPSHVFLLATLLLMIVEVEVVEGWHLIHLVELLGIMLVLSMGWATWRVARILKR